MLKSSFLLTGCFLIAITSLKGQCSPDRDAVWKYILRVIDSSQISYKKKAEILKADLEKMNNCPYRDDSTHAFLLQIIGEAYFGQSDFLNAVKYYRQSIDMITANEGKPSVNPKKLIVLYYVLSLLYDSLNNVSEEMKAVNNCIEIAMKLKLPSDLSSVCSFYTRVKHSFDMGDYSRCIDDARLCERFAREYMKTVPKGSNEYKKGEAIALSSLGWYVNVQLLVNDFAAAEEFLANKADEYKKAGLQNYLGLVYAQVATVQLQKQEYNKALTSLKTALQFARKAGKDFMCKQIENTIGYDVYFSHFNDLDKALSSYKNALAYKNKDSYLAKADTMESLSIFVNIANVYVQKKSFDSAFKYFQLAFDQVKAGTDEKNISQISAEDLSKFEKLYYLENLLVSKADAFRKRYEVSGQAGDIEKSVAIYKVADRLLDRIREVQFDPGSKLFWRKDSYRLYEKAINACYLVGNAADAFYFFEKSRAVLLTDQLIQQRWLGLEEISKQARIKKEILQLERESAITQAASRRYAEIQGELFTLKQQLDNIERQIRIHAPLYSLATGAIPLTLPDAKKNLLKDHQALLEIFSGDHSIYILLVTSGNTYFTKINKADFEKAASLFISYFRERDRINSDFAGFRTASYRLYKLIFQNNVIPKGRIIISPDGGSYFPFEALITDSSSADPVYFLADHAVSYTYSARYLVNRFASYTVNSSGNFLGVAPVDFPGGFHLPALPGSDISLKKISAYIKSPHTLVAKNASRNNFLQQFTGYRIIQLYTHSSDSSDRKEPVIYFADSSLYLSDLIPENMPAAQLIVLSACETGSGKVYKGEGVFSFNRGFAAMGIPSSISNLWVVDNISTYQLTEYFYKHLSEGLTLDVALQKAKLEFLATASGEYKLPYYWAPAVLIGKTDPIKYKSSVNWKYFLLIAGLAGIILWGLSRAVGKKK